MTKPKSPTYTENRDHCCWIIGYNAFKAGTPRRLNQFKFGSEGHAQWFYGWDTAYWEKPRERSRMPDVPLRNHEAERARRRKGGSKAAKLRI